MVEAEYGGFTGQMYLRSLLRGLWEVPHYLPGLIISDGHLRCFI